MSRMVDKNKKIQFDLVNTTSSPINVDLFNLDRLTNVPTEPSSSSGVELSDTYNVVDFVQYLTINEDNGEIYVPKLNNTIDVLDSDGNLITNIALNAGANEIAGKGVYSSANGKVYYTDSSNATLIIIDASTYTIDTRVTLTGSGRCVAYDPTNDNVWVGTSSGTQPVQVVDGSTYAIITTVSISANSIIDAFYDSDNQQVVFVDGFLTSSLKYFNANTFANTANVAISFAFAQSLTIIDSKIYVGYAGQTVIEVYNSISTTFITSISMGGSSTTIHSLTFDNDGFVYAYNPTIGILQIDSSTDTISETITGVALTVEPKSVKFWSGGNRLLAGDNFSNNIYVFNKSTIPFYITSSGDYNQFIQSLEFQPIVLKCIGIYPQTQEQLYNPLQFKTKDSNGHEYSLPEFPIIDVSAWQQQGERAKIPIREIVFDGRTFFSDYRINANERVVFELCYDELNRFCFAEFPQLFPEKIPLSKVVKESIDKAICKREESHKEIDSSWECKEGKKVFSMTVTNPTGVLQFANIFDNFNFGDFNPNLTIQDSGSYSYFTESLGEDPIRVSCMDVISGSQEQLNNNFVVQNKDATGYIHSEPISPIVKVDTSQNQGGRSFIEFEKLIFDGNVTFSSYPINPNETVTLVFYYHQFKRASLIDSERVQKVKLHPVEPIIDYGKLDKLANRLRHKCSREANAIEITVSNTTGVDSAFNFFVANQTQLIVNQPNAQFDNVEDYNFLVQQLRQSPIVLCGMDVIGSDQEQLTEPLNVSVEDASGDALDYQHFPINFVNPKQNSGNRIFINTNHLILDGYNTIPSYNIKANSRITFVLYYRPFLRSDFLKNHVFHQSNQTITDGTQVGQDIEYYNDVSAEANNKWHFKKETERLEREFSNLIEKSVIFDAEQVYSKSINDNRLTPISDILYRKMLTKYASKKGGCKIDTPKKQKVYVNPNDLDLGDSDEVVDISQQGFAQFKNKKEKPIGRRNFRQGSQKERLRGQRGWTYSDIIIDGHNIADSKDYKSRLKPL